MAKISIQTTKTAMPRCYCYTTPTISDHDGWVKIGYTEQDDVEDRIRQQLQTAHIPHHTEWSDIAVFADGRTYFRDSDFHAYLKKQGVERMSGSASVAMSLSRCTRNSAVPRALWIRSERSPMNSVPSRSRRSRRHLTTL